MAVVNHERQSPFPSRPNRGGSNASKAKKREEADKKIKNGLVVCIAKLNQFLFYSVKLQLLIYFNSPYTPPCALNCRCVVLTFLLSSFNEFAI